MIENFNNTLKNTTSKAYYEEALGFEAQTQFYDCTNYSHMYENQEIIPHIWAVRFDPEFFNDNLLYIIMMSKERKPNGKKKYHLDSFVNTFINAMHIASSDGRHFIDGNSIITSTLKKTIGGNYNNLNRMTNKFFIKNKIISGSNVKGSNDVCSKNYKSKGVASSYLIEPLKYFWYKRSDIIKFVTEAIENEEFDKESFLKNVVKVKASNILYIQNKKAIENGTKIKSIKIEKIDEKIEKIENLFALSSIKIIKLENYLKKSEEAFKKRFLKGASTFSLNDYFHLLSSIKKAPLKAVYKDGNKIKKSKKELRLELSEFKNKLNFSKKTWKMLDKLAEKRSKLLDEISDLSSTVSSCNVVLNSIEDDKIFFVSKINEKTFRDYSKLSNIKTVVRNIIFSDFFELDVSNMSWTSLLNFSKENKLNLKGFEIYVQHRDKILEKCSSFDTPLEPKMFFLQILFGGKNLDFKRTREIYEEDNFLKDLFSQIFTNIKTLKENIKSNFSALNVKNRWSFEFENKNILSLVFMNVESNFMNGLSEILDCKDIFRLHDALYVTKDLIPTLDQIEEIKDLQLKFNLKIKNVELFFMKNDLYRQKSKETSEEAAQQPIRDNNNITYSVNENFLDNSKSSNLLNDFYESMKNIS